MNTQQPSRNISATPQKPYQRASSSSKFSPLTSCINLPLSQNSALPKSYYVKPKEPENQLSYPRVMVIDDNRYSKSIEKIPDDNPASQLNSSANKSIMIDRNSNVQTPFKNSQGFDINVMKEMQMKFKKLLEENEKLKCTLIQKNNLEEQNIVSQQIANSQIAELEEQRNEYKFEINKMKSQLDEFQHQNENNVKILQETEEKLVNYLKSNETSKSANKTLAFENINLKKTIEDLLTKSNAHQNKIKQDAAQLQKYEETLSNLSKEQESLINAWNFKYGELQQNFVLEKNLHQQSEKTLKSKIQSLEEERKLSNEKIQENNENFMNVQKDLNEAREKVHILEYKIQENQSELSNYKDIENRVGIMKQDNEKLIDLISQMKNEREMYFKEIEKKQNENDSLYNQLDDSKKHLIEFKYEVEALKKKAEESETNKISLEKEISANKEERQELVKLNETWESKINTIILETERLSTILKEKDNFIENIQSAYQGLETSFQNLQKEYQNCDKELKTTQMFNSESSKKLEEMEAKLTQIQKTKDQLESDKKAIIHFYEDNRIKQDKEMENLRCKYNGIVKDLEETRQRYEEYRSFKIDDKSTQLKFKAEKSALETEMLQMKNKITEYEIAYNALLKKTEDLHSRNNDNNNERECLQLEFSDKIETLEKQNKELLKITEKLRNCMIEKDETILKLEVLRKKSEGQIKELKEIIQINKEEIDKLYDFKNHKNTEMERMQNEIEKLNEENNGLLKENKDVKKFLSKFKEEENNYRKTIEILTNTSKDYKIQIDQFSNELNVKNKELIEKIDDMDRMKENYSKTLEKIEVLETKLLNKLQQK